jgi:hypothetical protein
VLNYLKPTRSRSRFSAMIQEQPTLDQFLLLSLLLHALLVVLFGDANGGGIKRGEKIWGSMNVTLQRLVPEPGGGQQHDAGATVMRSFGSRAETQAARPAPDRLPQKQDAAPLEAATPASESVRKTLEPIPPMPLLPGTTPTPELQRFLAKEVETPVTDFVVAPPTIARELPAPLEKLSAPKIDRELANYVAPMARVAPFIPPPPLETIVLPKVSGEFANYAEPKPRRAPFVTPPPMETIATPKIERELTTLVEPKPRAAPFVPPQPLERVAPVLVEREFTSMAPPRPQPTPIVTPPPIDKVAPVRIDREFSTYVPPVPKPVPFAAPAPLERVSPVRVEDKLEAYVAPKPAPAPKVAPVPAEPLQTLAPAKIERDMAAAPVVAVPAPPAPAVAPAVRRAPPAPIERVAPARIDSDAATLAATPRLARTAPTVDTAPATTSNATTASRDRDLLNELARPTDAGNGAATAVTPGTAPGAGPRAESRAEPLDFDTDSRRRAAALPRIPGAATPRLNLDNIRGRVREMAKEGTGPRTLLPFPMVARPENKTRTQQIFDKALKPNDCRDAYAGLGLLAIVPLLADSVRENGCKW